MKLSVLVLAAALVAVLVGMAMASMEAEPSPSPAVPSSSINGFTLAEMITHDRVTGAIASLNMVSRADAGTCDNYSDCSGACSDPSGGNDDSRVCKNSRLFTQTTEGLLVVIAIAIVFCMCPCCWPCCVVCAIPIALVAFALLISQITAFRYSYKF